MKQDLELKLQSWLDGELSESEANRVARMLDNDADAALLVGELRLVKTAMIGGEMARTVPETREFYWSKIQRQIESEARQPRQVETPERTGWVRWLAPLAGISALACMMFLAVKPAAPLAFDEYSTTGEGTEAVTFHDQSAGMTVVWLADSEQAQQQMEAPEVKAPEAADTDVEME